MISIAALALLSAFLADPAEPIEVTTDVRPGVKTVITYGAPICAGSQCKTGIKIKTVAPVRRRPVGTPYVAPAAVRVQSTTVSVSTRSGTFLGRHRLRDWHPLKNLRSRMRGC